jgi:hypothetical protein
VRTDRLLVAVTRTGLADLLRRTAGVANPPPPPGPAPPRRLTIGGPRQDGANPPRRDGANPPRRDGANGPGRDGTSPPSTPDAGATGPAGEPL